MHVAVSSNLRQMFEFADKNIKKKDGVIGFPFGILSALLLIILRQGVCKGLMG